MPYELGFLGAGNMAEAIANAAVAKGVLSPDQLIASDPSQPRREVFTNLGITAVDDNSRVIRESRQILIAVKPQVMGQAAAGLAADGREDQVVISIMAGVTCAGLTQAVGRPTRVIRVMPNTPVLVGYGMAGIARGVHAQPGDEDLAHRLFTAGGQAIIVDETDLDAITAVSGSGPAYVFYLAEAMQQAAEAMGLKPHARLLVQQTILGAAMLMTQSDDSPAELRRKVTSPGGTTEAAITSLEQSGVGSACFDAMKAARQRSEQLGR